MKLAEHCPKYIGTKGHPHLCTSGLNGATSLGDCPRKRHCGGGVLSDPNHPWAFIDPKGVFPVVYRYPSLPTLLQHTMLSMLINRAGGDSSLTLEVCVRVHACWGKCVPEKMCVHARRSGPAIFKLLVYLSIYQINLSTVC